jgi:hypothetical protein
MCSAGAGGQGATLVRFCDPGHGILTAGVLAACLITEWKSSGLWQNFMLLLVVCDMDLAFNLY